jgi:hypothetical protein
MSGGYSATNRDRRVRGLEDLDSRQDRPRVRITNVKHPHYPEHGWWTGEVITLVTGAVMGKVELQGCVHGTDACFVKADDIVQEKP